MTAMEYLHIEYFVKVAETENLSRAAEMLNVSQPSLSQTIRRLEDELGVELFDRKGKRIVLNDAGKRFLVYANQSLNALNEARRAVSSVHHEKLRGHITICCLFFQTCVHSGDYLSDSQTFYK